LIAREPLRADTEASWRSPKHLRRLTKLIFEMDSAMRDQVTGCIDVSVIIVNWNRLADVLKNIHYLRFQKDVRLEVVVVDGGSTDGSADFLARLDGIKFVGLDSNVGPCGARNVGIQNSSGRYLVFLDSDAILSKWKLAQLVRRMDQDSTIGILACRIIDSSIRKPDQWIYPEPASTHQLREFDTYSFSACGTIVRPEALHHAGMFWEELFIYNEEVDLSIRVLRAGYRIVHFPAVRVYHRPSTEGRCCKGTYWRYQIRNWIWIFYRHYPLVPRVRKVVIYIGVYLIKSAMKRQLTATVTGMIEGLRKTEIISRYPDKMTAEEVRRIGALNARKKIRFDH
jgi:GT2 family glycosyltransferase